MLCSTPGLGVPDSGACGVPGHENPDPHGQPSQNSSDGTEAKHVFRILKHVCGRMGAVGPPLLTFDWSTTK